MLYEKPTITDLGSIVEHTFTNTAKKPGHYRSNPGFPVDRFDEPSHS